MATKIVMRQRSALKLRYQAGAVGPAGTITILDTITGAPGTDAEVANTGTDSAAELTFTIPRGNTGLTGDKGWAPILAVVNDGTRRVLQVNDWTGGEGTKPATGSYIGASGLVSAIGDAVDIRGATGPAGSVTDGDKGDITVSSSGTVWTVDGGYIPNAGGSTTGPITINGTRFGQFSASAQIQSLSDNSVGRVLDLGDFPNLTTAASSIRFYRNTNTSGAKTIDMYRGDGTTTLDHRLVSGTSGTLADLCRNGGNATVGGNLVWHAGNTDDAVTNAKLANMATARIKGRVTASTGDPEDLTGAQARSVLGLTDASATDVVLPYVSFLESTARGYDIKTRSVVTTFPVPTFRPTQSNTVMTLDVMPNGSPSESSGNGYAWLDVCAQDVRDNNNAVNASRIAATSTAHVFGGVEYNGATARNVEFRAGGSSRWGVAASGGGFYPVADNAYSLGFSSLRPTVIYAVSGTINTSDEREKQDIEPIPDEVLDAWADVEFVQFRWRDAVSAKGKDARLHAGLIAQRVDAAFKARGLDATRYGLLCYDEWPDEWVDLPEQTRETGKMKRGKAEVEIIPPQRVLRQKAGNRWSIRADQCLFMEAALQRRTMRRLEARLLASGG